MLRTVILASYPEAASQLRAALEESNRFHVEQSAPKLPDSGELELSLRVHVPDVVFVEVESLEKTTEIIHIVEVMAPGLPVVAFARVSNHKLLLELMRNGVREFLDQPCPAGEVVQLADRLELFLEHHPPEIQSTDQVYAFLPAKPGVGASTIALNVSVALSAHPEDRVVLGDLDLMNGLIGFMFGMKGTFTVLDAIEKTGELDENLWPRLVTPCDRLDVLPAGVAPTGYHVPDGRIHSMLSFMRRLYQRICLDLSGGMEDFSIESLREAKRIFLVCTPEIPVLHLARRRLDFIDRLDLRSRVLVIINRWGNRNAMSLGQIEDLLGASIFSAIGNDYNEVHRALMAGCPISHGSALGKQFRNLAKSIQEEDTASSERSRRSLSRLEKGLLSSGNGSSFSGFRRRWNYWNLFRRREHPATLGLPEMAPAMKRAFNSPAQVSTMNGPTPAPAPIVDASPVPFSTEEARSLLEACDRGTRGKPGRRQRIHGQLKAFVMLLLYTDLSASDVVRLSTDRFVDDKLLIGRPGSDEARWRDLPVEAVEALRRCPKTSPAHFFWNGTTDPETATLTWTRRLEKLCRAAGLAEVDLSRRGLQHPADASRPPCDAREPGTDAPVKLQDWEQDGNLPPAPTTIQ